MIKIVAFLLGTACLLGLFQAGTAQAQKAAEPFDDTTFVKKAASAGSLEVVLGNLAKKKAQSQPAKVFAEKMVTDHTKAGEDLKKAAAAANIPVPEMMSEKNQKTLDHFKNHADANFDKDYIAQMVADHEEAVALFTQASKEARNPALKDFATKTLPVLEEHLKMVKQIQSKQ
jgi:putative membrane protein